MTQLNKTAVTGLESGPVGVLPAPSRSGSVSAAAGRGRHSTRISVSLPVMVQDHLGTREQAVTHSVTSRGAILLLKSNVHVAQTITVQNLRNKKSAECHVIGVENMVNHLHKVEVEFTSNQNDFWPVQFPQERELEHSPETGNSHIDRGNIAKLSPEQASASGGREESVPDSHHLSSDPGANSSEEPPLAQDSDIALVLAAPIKQGSALEEPFHVRSFSSSAASMDSVAQFRAATRSASRRKQQIRSVSFLVSLAIAVSAVLAGRTMLRHHPLHLMRSSSAAVSETVSTNSSTQPATEPSDAPGPLSSVETPQIAPQPADAAATILTASSGGEQITLAPAPSGPAAEIAVRHGSALSSERKSIADDEPIALPLRSAAEMRAGAEINQVLARPARANAVLAPQPKAVLRPARLLTTVQPEYPATARQYRVQGEVVMNLEVDASGKVAEVKVVSGPPMLRIAAESAVRQWKYQPATLGDKPVSSSMTAKLDFHLR